MLFRKLLFVAAAAAASVTLPAQAAVTLIGVGQIPGTATDQSGLTDLLEDNVTPHNQIGGLGSALAWSGRGNVYYATPDRGPADGATRYINRLYTVQIDLTRVAPYGTRSFQVTPTVTATTLLRDRDGTPLVGSSGAFDSTNSPAGLRFDPEGLRVSACSGAVYVSDEYGPFIYRFNTATGRRINAVRVPTKLLLDAPSVVASEELVNNAFGRQANRGMEGLAISPSGDRLYGLMQSPLIQDGGLGAGNARVGTNARLVEVDLASGAFREFVYVLDAPSLGTNEILAIDDDSFLVIERDGRIGSAATVKRVYRVDLAGATDVRSLPSLPSTGLPAGVTPVAKTLLVDLLDPAYGLAANIPEKIEGLAFGPRVAGRQTLVVTSDNDFIGANPSQFYVFGLDDSDLPDYQPQQRGACR